MAGVGTGPLRRVVFGAAMALTTVVAACGSDSTSVADTVVDSSETPAADATLSTADAGDGTVGTTAVPPKALADDVLPGTAFDMFPYEGAELTVVGVAADDVLNVRVGPGPEFQVVTTLAPTSSGDAVATGRNRDVESGIWAEIRMGGIIGWANTAFLMQVGSVDDDTASLFPTAGEHPVGESPEDLALEVAEAFASLEPDSTVVVTDGPHHGDLVTVTVDVIGLGDDAIGGYRVLVFLETLDSTYRVRTVETTTLCTRGVDGGMCL